MKRDNPLLTRVRGIRLLGRNTLWLAAFALLAVLGLVLVFTLKPWVLKLLFLLIAIGAVLYCWLLLEDRRSTPRPAKASSPPEPQNEPAAVEAEDEAEDETEDEASGQEAADEVLEEGSESGEQGKPLVLVSEKGDKYHRDRKCMGLRFADSVEEMPEEEAAALDRKPCGICWPKAKEQ